MNIIIKELNKKTPELKHFLKISIDHKREISGAYRCNFDLESNYLQLVPRIRFGTANSVPHITQEKSTFYVLFHTHLSEYSPPSGNDIIALLYKILRHKSEYALVIDLNAIYIYSIKASLMSVVSNMLSASEPTDEWMSNLIKKIDHEAISYNKNRNIELYFKRMFDLGVEVQLF